MSVINQVLIDLERRRASGAERGALPNHVRALPDGGHAPNWGWITAGGVIASAALLVSWTMLTGFDLRGKPVAAPAMPRHGAEIAIEKVVSASAGVKVADTPREEQAFRLSLELSTPPARETMDARTPLPTERVVGGGAVAPAAATGGEPPTAPTRGRASARPATVASAREPVASAAATPQIKKEVREPTPRELADNEYRKATAWLHQRSFAEAHDGFQAALDQFPGHHAARQALVGVLLEQKRYAEAEQVLQEGLRLAPAQTGFAMTLARLQVNRDDNAAAIGTLRAGLDYASGSADYLAFLAALLQRQGAHAEAIQRFQAALRIRPGAGVWWLGLGISLQSTGRPANAQDAFRRARATNSLSPELAAFADQRLRQPQ